jgi:hypothetical protein
MAAEYLECVLAGLLPLLMAVALRERGVLRPVPVRKSRRTASAARHFR